MDKKYCYPDSDVLINKLGIQDENKLHTIERQLTTQNDIALKLNPIKGNFDIKHLQAIHKAIFNDLYSWAGKLRDVNIAKTRMFCLSQHIPAMADDIFGKLRKDKFLVGLKQSDFIDKLSYYMGEVNALHPFREGNGRTQRHFFTQLAECAGYSLDFSKTDRQTLLSADINAMDGKYDELKKVLNICVKPLQIEFEKVKPSVLEKLETAKKEVSQSITKQSKKKDIDMDI